MPFDPGLADRVRQSLYSCPGLSQWRVTEKRMFGGLAFMVDGHLCCGVRMDLMLRVGRETAERVSGNPHVRPMNFTGTPISSMIYVDADGTDSDEDLNRWISQVVAYVLSLPMKKAPKKPKS